MLTRCCGACRPPISGGCRLCPSGPSSAQSWSAFSLLDALRLMRREAACELPKLPRPIFVAVMRCSKAPAPPADADTCSRTQGRKEGQCKAPHTMSLGHCKTTRFHAAAGQPLRRHATTHMNRLADCNSVAIMMTVALLQLQQVAEHAITLHCSSLLQCKPMPTCAAAMLAAWLKADVMAAW